MSADSPPGGPLATPLARRAGTAPSVEQVAAAMGEICLEIDRVLGPIVGPRGVAALGRRSLHLATGAGPAAPDHAIERLDDASWRRRFAGLAAAEAAALGERYLQAFRDLLATLIGPSLTDRHLRPVWRSPEPPAAPTGGPTPQDPSP